MAEQDEKLPVTIEQSSDSTPGDRKRRGCSGCLVLFLLGLPVLDAFGMVMSMAGQYCHIVLALGLAGFVFGAVVGAYLYVIITKEPWWSSYWWAVAGLLGLCLPGLITLALLPKAQ
jgi:hypothetical protein